MVTAHRGACFALIALAAEREHDAGDTDNDIDRALKPRPASEKHMDDIPVAAEEAAETNQAPVDRTHKHEPKADGRHRAALILHTYSHRKRD